MSVGRPMTTRRTLVPCAIAVLVLCAAGAASGAAPDKGSDRPPSRVAAASGVLNLTEDFKSIWMTEWAACWRVSMGHLSGVLHIPIHAGVTPQQAAKKLSNRAVYLLYETTPETVAAADGCRNGILWRYYHPSG